ncbi:MAG: DUF4265 domain-containing protein [Acidiferrobacteraceae bacterium]
MNTETKQAKVMFRVADGEGGEDVETLWAIPLGGDLYKIDNSPFYAYGVSLGDTVEAPWSEEHGFPVFRRVVEKSGVRTVRVILDSPAENYNESQQLLDEIAALGCGYEGANRSYITIDIPKEVDLWKVRNFLIEKQVKWEHADPKYDELFPDAE